MTIRTMAAVGALLLAGSAAMAQTAGAPAAGKGAPGQDAAAQLAQQKNCTACHAIDKKLVGPAYKDVAAKYAGNKDAVAMLVTKVQKGGVGTWGQVPMPPNPVSEAEARQLVEWVLKQK